ncbi:MAG: small metal-binding protein SmbP [Methylovulum sp.]|nr:small metal-binding protein SmbP [Methylovulum sp.]
MKKLAFLCAGLFLILSTAVFAQEHASEALEHANAAVEHGKAGHAPILVEHAKLALEHTLAGSLVAKGQAKTHLDAASKSLQDAIDHGGLDETDMATKAAEEAVGHINASKK